MSDLPRKDRLKKDRAEASYLPDIHRLLPASADAEQGYICSALLAPSEILGESPLAPEKFHIPAHATIVEQMLAMHEARQPIDLVTVTQWLRDRNRLDEVGGAAFITQLFTFMATSANCAYYAAIIEEKFILRELIRHCTRIAGRCYDEQAEPAAILDEAVTQMLEIEAGRSEEDTIKHIKEHAAKAAEEIEYAYRNRGGTVGLRTGFQDLDRMLGGWQKGFTYYFGARPAMGKSSLGLNMAIHSAAAAVAGERDHGCPVLFFSVEMTGPQLAKRLIFTLAQINQQRARDGFLSTERDWAELHKAVEKTMKSRLYVDETAALTIAAFRARARRWLKKMRRQNGPRQDGKPDAMIWIDYLQRMKGSSKRSEDARYLELQEIAQGISQTAKELQVPIGILAQLKRPKDKKPDTEPDMTEFRECGDIEQEAHVVALIHRPFYYVKSNKDKQQALAEDIEGRMKWALPESKRDAFTFTVEDLKRYAKLIIDKQREGPVGPIDLRFVADYTKFETWDPARRLYSNNDEQRQMVAEGEA